MTSQLITSNTVLPARREEVVLTTADGLHLVGEIAQPLTREPVATLITLHPLPTQGGFMDSHVLRKAAARLPALADLAVLRFNTRGTRSPRGRSEGHFDSGNGERFDVDAAVRFVTERGLPHPWLVGWSFGTELALGYGSEHPEIEGAVLLSPPLRRVGEAELKRWEGTGKPLLALVPELDDYLRPAEAIRRFHAAAHAEVIGVDGAKHLWVGEKQVSRVLNEIVRLVNPAAYPLPEEYDEYAPPGIDEDERSR